MKLQQVKRLKSFGGQKNLGRIIFPYLLRSGLDFVYEIACVSSIVGMKVPETLIIFKFKYKFQQE